jgi:Na+-translocating ferredoxin:NAD+ oxidoreductase subunit B
LTAADRVYRDLQRYLDRLPAGFPEVASGLDVRLLQRLFTPEEARLAMHLSMTPEPFRRVYGRVRGSGISEAACRRLLDGMLHKGTILSVEEGYDEPRYCSAEFTAGGIYNFQVNRLTRELIEEYRQYLAESRARPVRRGPWVRPLRTIPVEESIPLPAKYRVADYDSVRRLVENAAGKIAVTDCICRQSQAILGEKCRRTDLYESCLLIGSDHARRHVEMGIGRYITKDEAFDILRRAQQAGLVLQPENSQRPEAICCCCGDCCVLLRMLPNHPRPVDLYDTNFYVEVDREKCTGCEVCVEKCQLDARVMTGGIAEVKLERCIGCGNCVALCPAGANRLVQKEPAKVPVKDKTAYNMKVLSGKVGRWQVFKLRLKMRLGLKV